MCDFEEKSVASRDNLSIRVSWGEGLPGLASTISLRSSNAVFLLMTPKYDFQLQNMSLLLLVAISFSLDELAVISRESGVCFMSPHLHPCYLLPLRL